MPGSRPAAARIDQPTHTGLQRGSPGLNRVSLYFLGLMGGGGKRSGDRREREEPEPANGSRDENLAEPHGGPASSNMLGLNLSNFVLTTE
jgi:hypothetical protein